VARGGRARLADSMCERAREKERERERPDAFAAKEVTERLWRGPNADEKWQVRKFRFHCWLHCNLSGSMSLNLESPEYPARRAAAFTVGPNT